MTQHGLLRVVTVAHRPYLTALAGDAGNHVEPRRNALDIMAALRSAREFAHIPTASSASSAACFASVEYLGS